MVCESSVIYRRRNLGKVSVAAVADLLAAVHSGLRDLADVITATQLSLPGDIQPLWGPDERRVMP